ncbi:hypothetical protein CVT26_009590 [Gymnopilus dilepis]|uniref:GPI-anchored wall transfer protein n=1 Tax=Gymnopilus dilepis TaxID=231916 RepID=A0A409YII7_9AGAR|nr:hypothetical protein CVT26_009590 [Gymnopilus dilepis]
MGESYKQAKENFVSGATGSSITHVNLISLVALSAVALYAAIRTRTPPSRQISFFASWAILVFPMLLSMTVAANHPLYLNILLLIPAAIVLRYPKTESGTPLPSSQPASPVAQTRMPTNVFTPDDESEGRRAARLEPLPALTTYRAHMMLMTVLAILAVDFPVFPRSLAKCETFGVSLMDLGVGSFVFSQGVVSAIPIVKDASYLQAPLLPKLIKVTRKCLPIIALGLVRVLLVKGTEYPEHVTEYGVHWNFFITLAVLPILQVCLHPFLVKFPISMVGVLVAIAQHIALSHFKLKEYVLSAPRTSLLSANKEGLVSLLGEDFHSGHDFVSISDTEVRVLRIGYLAIQLLGLSAGTLILPPTPSFFRRRQQALVKDGPSGRKRRDSDPPAATDVRQNIAASSSESRKTSEVDLSAPRQLDKTATELCAYAILWWSLLGLARLTRLDGRWSGEGVSRRMVSSTIDFACVSCSKIPC